MGGGYIPEVPRLPPPTGNEFANPVGGSLGNWGRGPDRGTFPSVAVWRGFSGAIRCFLTRGILAALAHGMAAITPWRTRALYSVCMCRIV